MKTTIIIRIYIFIERGFSVDRRSYIYSGDKVVFNNIIDIYIYTYTYTYIDIYINTNKQKNAIVII